MMLQFLLHMTLHYIAVVVVELAYLDVGGGGRGSESGRLVSVGGADPRASAEYEPDWHAFVELVDALDHGSFGVAEASDQRLQRLFATIFILYNTIMCLIALSTCLRVNDVCTLA